MAPTLLLIDALNLIRRIHAAIPSREPQADENQQVDGALSATLSSVQRAIKECNPSHILMVFDGDPPTWRHQLLPGYKTQRKPMPMALRQRLVEFNNAFREMGLMTFRRNGIEADDVIGAITHKAIAANVKTVILSTDKAYRQLLHSPLVIQRDHFQKENFDSASVCTEYGMPPEKLLDYWGMAGVGDVPGVEGVGKKGATELLNRFGSLNGIFEPEVAHGEKVKGALKKVLEQREQAELSVRLATLQHDVELGLSLKDLRYQEKTQG
ncbi:5'-3' exonuclease H3TH domain-containing protein [Endozoicomonas sp. YOMI1]|uniref:5'-3' exonuclease H3TH domain-containing protein n=1 Tax=Endozoicomonas sp. YOMI1 TaxID=2828739 RepID=UPI002148C2D9|nr:5'-3' exonuclease H3TH domain-containing protein [Endozoicomonas sp. YOMI1]